MAICDTYEVAAGILRVFGWLQAMAEGLQYVAPDARLHDDDTDMLAVLRCPPCVFDSAFVCLSVWLSFCTCACVCMCKC